MVPEPPVVCKGCGEKVSSGTVVQALNSDWHPRCFRCSTCGKRLDNWYTLHKGRLYCRRDYWAKFRDACNGCSFVISGPVMVAGEHRYHPECFQCCACQAFIGDGEPYALLERSFLYCGDCYRKSVVDRVPRRQLSAGQHLQTPVTSAAVPSAPQVTPVPSNPACASVPTNPARRATAVPTVEVSITPPPPTPSTDSFSSSSPPPPSSSEATKEETTPVTPPTTAATAVTLSHSSSTSSPSLSLTLSLATPLSVSPPTQPTPRRKPHSIQMVSIRPSQTQHKTSSSSSTPSPVTTPTSPLQRLISQDDHSSNSTGDHSKQQQHYNNNNNNNSNRQHRRSHHRLHQQQQQQEQEQLQQQLRNAAAATAAMAEGQGQGPSVVDLSSLTRDPSSSLGGGDLPHKDQGDSDKPQGSRRLQLTLRTLSPSAEDVWGMSGRRSRGKRSGLATESGKTTPNITISQLWPGSELEGLEVGDRILEVNGDTVKEKTLEEISSLLTSSSGPVTVMLERDLSPLRLSTEEPVSPGPASPSSSAGSHHPLNRGLSEGSHSLNRGLSEGSHSLNSGLSEGSHPLSRGLSVGGAAADVEPAKASGDSGGASGTVIVADEPVRLRPKNSLRAKGHSPSRRRSKSPSPCPSSRKSIDLSRSHSFTTHSQQHRVFRATDLLLGEVLGQGFFGQAIKAVHKVTGEIMVLKELHNFDEDAQKSFLREVSMLRNVSHPCVLKFLGVLYRDKKLNLVTEFIDGGTLSSLLLDHSKELAWKQRVAFAKDIANGMNYLHSIDIIHRDLNSQNCLVRMDQTVVVADFGLAKICPRHEQLELALSSGKDARDSLSTIGEGVAQGSGSGGKASSSSRGAGKKKRFSRRKRQTVVGNPYWMAPEMMTKGIYDEKVDVFSFGIIVCETIARVTADPDYLPRSIDFGLNVEAFHKRFCQDTPEPYFMLAVLCSQMEPDQRPSFDKIYMLCEALFLHVEHKMAVPVELQGSTVEFYRRFKVETYGGNFKDIDSCTQADGVASQEKTTHTQQGDGKQEPSSSKAEEEMSGSLTEHCFNVDESCPSTTDVERSEKQSNGSCDRSTDLDNPSSCNQALTSSAQACSKGDNSDHVVTVSSCLSVVASNGDDQAYFSCPSSSPPASPSSACHFSSCRGSPESSCGPNTLTLNSSSRDGSSSYRADSASELIHERDNSGGTTVETSLSSVQSEEALYVSDTTSVNRTCAQLVSKPTSLSLGDLNHACQNHSCAAGVGDDDDDDDDSAVKRTLRDASTESGIFAECTPLEHHKDSIPKVRTATLSNSSQTVLPSPCQPSSSSSRQSDARDQTCFDEHKSKTVPHVMNNEMERCSSA